MADASPPHGIGQDVAPAVGRLVTGAPISVSPDTTVRAAAEIMSRAGVSSVLVGDDGRGIVTDRDLRDRVVAEGLHGDTPVEQVMSKPLLKLPADTPLFDALLFMVQHHVHHIPVERNGEIVGVVTDTDLLRHEAAGYLYPLSAASRTKETEAPAGHNQRVVEAIEHLLRNGVDPIAIGRAVSTLNDKLVRSLLELAEKKLGPPPVPYTWLALGSEGRVEQLLLTDQDNALVFAEGGRDESAYFADLAEEVIAGLLRAGFPPCKGGYVATKWHGSLESWVERFEGWIGKPEPRALLRASILFDFRPVHGSLDLEPLHDVLRSASGDQIFLGHLAANALHFRPPLGLFGRIRKRDGAVDLKSGGISPIVGLGRLHAMEAASSSRNTIARLEDAAGAEVISEYVAESLSEAFAFLLEIRLQHHLKAVRRDEEPTNSMMLSDLSSLRRRHLKEAFRAIKDHQEMVALSYRTDALA